MANAKKIDTVVNPVSARAHRAAVTSARSLGGIEKKADTAIASGKAALIELFRSWLSTYAARNVSPTDAECKALRKDCAQAYFDAKGGSCSLESAQRFMRDYYDAAANNKAGDNYTKKDKARDTTVAKQKAEKAAAKVLAPAPVQAAPAPATGDKAPTASNHVTGDHRAELLVSIRSAMADVDALAAWSTKPATLTPNQVAQKFGNLAARLKIIEAHLPA